MSANAIRVMKQATTMSPTDAEQLTTQQIIELLPQLGNAYRAGKPEVSDETYDALVAVLKRRQPDHPLLHTVEAEPDGVFGEKIRHPAPMLSTDKAYTQAEVSAWVKRVREATEELGLDVAAVRVRCTAKLDGLAGRDDGAKLATRGDGVFGQDVTAAFARGVVPVGGRGAGVGELVIEQAYFEQHVAQQFDMDHPRNYMAGLIGSDEIKPHHAAALEAGVCRFVPYTTLPAVVVGLEQFEESWQDIMVEVREVPYKTDGAVAQVDDAQLRERLGSTSHFHRWMLALKAVGERAQTTVERCTLQTGRLGRITPVLELRPVRLSGAEIRRVTAHTGRHLERLGLGPGAVLQIVRSGDVIPYIEKVIEPSGVHVDTSRCPSCGGTTTWDGDYLICQSTQSCPAQAARSLEHFFKTIGTANGFGPSVCDLLCKAGYTQPEQIYQMQQHQMVRAGIGAGVVANLIGELQRSRAAPLRDYLLLGALGIKHLGRGDSRKLLSVYDIEQVGTLTAEQIRAIPGFGEMTSGAIAQSLQARAGQLQALLAVGFNLERSKATKQTAATSSSAIAGKKVVFTGAMSGSRDEMEKQAAQLGAIVQSGVSKATDLLICGDKVGASKLTKAQSLGVKVISEAEYQQLIGQNV